MAVSWEDVVAHALMLPEVEESTSYRTPSLKVAGKLMARLRTEDDGGLAIKCSTSDKEARRLKAPVRLRKAFDA